MLKKHFSVIILCIFLITGQISCKEQKLTQQEKNLLEQLYAGNSAEIARLVKSGTNIRIKDQHGNTPLHLVALRGDCESIKLLLNKGAKINATNDNDDTPLHEAADNGRLEAAKLLIEKGANVNAKNKQGKTPIYPAAHSGNLDLVKLLVSKGAKIQTTGYTPLHEAVRNSSLRQQPEKSLVDMVKYLLPKGINVNAISESLYLAAYDANKEIIDLLIQNGAKVNKKGGNTPLFNAAIGGNVEAAEVLLDNEATVNARNDANDTPLHYAVMERSISTIVTLEERIEIVKLLIARGADVNARNKNQYTPLHYAVEVGWFKQQPPTPEASQSKAAYKTIIQMLLEKGADPNIKDGIGRTALELAEGEPEIIELLIKYGAKKDN